MKQERGRDMGARCGMEAQSARRMYRNMKHCGSEGGGKPLESPRQDGWGRLPRSNEDDLSRKAQQWVDGS